MREHRKEEAGRSKPHLRSHAPRRRIFAWSAPQQHLELTDGTRNPQQTSIAHLLEECAAVELPGLLPLVDVRIDVLFYYLQ